jgi:hypothetical protein
MDLRNSTKCLLRFQGNEHLVDLRDDGRIVVSMVHKCDMKLVIGLNRLLYDPVVEFICTVMNP